MENLTRVKKYGIINIENEREIPNSFSVFQKRDTISHVNMDLRIKLPLALNLGVRRDTRVSDMWQSGKRVIKRQSKFSDFCSKMFSKEKLILTARAKKPLDLTIHPVGIREIPVGSTKASRWLTR